MKKFAIIILLALLGVSVGLNLWLYSHPTFSNSDVKIETRIDTIPFYQPVPKDSIVLHYVTEKLPTSRNHNTASIDTVLLTEVRIDSVWVDIPITQKVYEDSLYRAYVSGFHANLDSIFVNRYSEKIFIPTTSKTKRFGIGIHAGYGYTPGKWQPYIGVGVSYTLFNF